MKVSIVMPVYNVSEFLVESLESLINQTLSDIEIICVDDESTDDSIKILEFYQQKDKRVKVIKQKHSYAGIARNNGLKHAQGEYIMFLDPDDFFDLNLCENLYKRAKETNADIVLCNTQHFNNQLKQKVPRTTTFYSSCVRNFEVFSANNFTSTIFSLFSPCPWNKFYRRQFILDEGILYQGIHNANDVFFSYIAVSTAKRISYVDKILVYHRTELTSSLQSTKSDHPDCFLIAIRAVYDELKRRKLLRKLNGSFTNSSLGSIVYNINTMSYEAKIKICNLLNSPLFLDMGLLHHKQSFYKDLNKYNFISRFMLLGQMEHLLDFSYKYEKEKYKEKYSISIIINVNCDITYLKECLDSIVTQKFDDYEIICLNKNNKTLKFLEHYPSKKIKILQIDSTVSHAKNQAMIRSHGKYVMFINSDDKLYGNSLKILYDLAENNDCDIISFDAINLDSIKDENHYRRSIKYPTNSGLHMIYNMMKNNDYHSLTSLYLIRKKHIVSNKLYFIPNLEDSDIYFTFLCCVRASKVYHTRRICLIHKKNKHNTARESIYNTFMNYNYLLAKVCEYNDNEIKELCSTYTNMLCKKTIQMYRGLSLKDRRFYKRLPSMEKTLFKWQIVNKDGKSLTYVRRKISKSMMKTPFSFIIKIYKKLNKINITCF